MSTVPRKSVGLGLCLASVLGHAQIEKPFEIEVGLTVAPKYVWRGINFMNDWSIQPEAKVSRGPLSFGVWAHIEPTNWNLANYTKSPRGRLTEIDLTLEYAKSLGPVEGTIGVVDYQFPGTGIQRYHEWYASVTAESLWGSPSLTVWTQGNLPSGTYATVGVSRSIPSTLFGVGEVDIDAELTYGDARSNQFYYGSSKTAFTDLHLTASKSLGIGGRLTFTPSGHFSTLLERSLLAGQPRRTNLWFSLSVGAKF